MVENISTFFDGYSTSVGNADSVMDTVMLRHKTARQAFAAGDYECALVMSDDEGDAELFACSLVMCGSIERGLKALEDLGGTSDEALICRAYGHWVRKNPKHMTQLVPSIKSETWNTNASKLCSIMSGNLCNVLILTAEPIQGSLPSPEEMGINAKIVKVDNTAWTQRIEDFFEADFKPNLILSLGAFGEYLPSGLFDIDTITVFFTGDSDLALTAQYDDLCRAQIIICFSFHEGDILSHLYPGRVVVFPGHTPYRESTPFVSKSTSKDLDVSLTGTLFRPYMAGKAKFAYQLAINDDPSLNIHIYDGHLDSEEYASLLGRSRLSPTNVRFAGGFQQRTLDAIRSGTLALTFQDRAAKLLLESTSFMIKKYSEEDPAKIFDECLSESARFSADFDQNIDCIKAEVDSIFLAPPERDIRLMKFALVQSIFLAKPESNAVSHSTTNDQTASNNKETLNPIYMPVTQFVTFALNGNYTRQFHVAMTNKYCGSYFASPTGGDFLRLVQGALDIAISQFPNSIALRFNRGRFNWMWGEYEQALGDFNWLEKFIQEGDLDVAREALLSYRIHGLSGLMPYEFYYRSALVDLQSGNKDAPNSRLVILATTLVYLALELLKNNKLESGVEHLHKALRLCPDHFPAARLLTKALWSSGQATSLHWFYRTIDMYPPYLSELLPFGVDCEQRAGNDDKAFEIVKNWALFMTRVDWSDQGNHGVSEDTLKSVRPYINRLEPDIRRKLIGKLEKISKLLKFDPEIIAEFIQ
jgi:tetratricopeptide (TPR) repeat protein